MMSFLLTPEISVPLMWEEKGSSFYCLFSYLIIFFFTVLNWEESSEWDGIFCQMPLMLLYSWALEILEELGQNLLVVCVCMRGRRGEARIETYKSRSGRKIFENKTFLFYYYAPSAELGVNATPKGVQVISKHAQGLAVFSIVTI